jgi:uncharacterized protein (DUF885 family)
MCGKMSISLLLGLLPTLLLAGLSSAYAQNKPAGKQSAAKQLHDLFEAEWEWSMRENPTRASHLGDLRYNDRWTDESSEAINRRQRHRRDVIEKLSEIDSSDLSASDKINFDLFLREYRMADEGDQHRWYLLPLTMRDGIQDAGSTADSLRFKTIKDYEDWTARMYAFPVYMDQTIELMNEGIRRKRMHPKVVMKRVPAQIRRQIVADPEKSLFFKPFRKFPNEISTEDRKRLLKDAKHAITNKVVPAYRKMLTFFEQDYLPACFDRVGVWQMTKGRELYAFRARKFTTTELTPKQIHEIGLKEVRRIRGEMDKVIKQVEFKGTFREFLDDLRTNPRFYYQNPNDLLKAYQQIGEKIEPQLPLLFGKLPRIPYNVEAIPPHIAPDTTTAYYRPPSADGRRPGTYFVNLYKPEVRPKYEIEALSLHEAVPGHHLQIALAMELENLPAFRRYGGYTAFIEGWGLYSESLGEEIGLYRDPYSKFGQLTYEMWRAVRLVVDTGMHAFQWTRPDAIEFFKENTAKTILDIENEVDRYITWPGQALAYKIGELKIRELRNRAEKQLGKWFDIRKFHDVVLGSGAVTLDILETNVNNWIAKQKSG